MITCYKFLKKYQIKKRICKYYGSEPQFIISTATLANPKEFGEKLCSELYWQAVQEADYGL